MESYGLIQWFVLTVGVSLVAVLCAYAVEWVAPPAPRTTTENRE